MADRRTYLFVTWEGGGNVPPVLGSARRLAVRGHTVYVLTEPSLEGDVRAAGASFVPFTRHFVRTSRSEDLVGDWRAANPFGALKRQFDQVMFGPMAIAARETREAIGATGADVVVADLMMPGALVAAEALNVPRAVLFHFPEYLPGPGRPAAGPGFAPRSDIVGRLRDRTLTALFLRLLGSYLPVVNEVRRAHGLPPHARAADILDDYHRADLRIIQTSAAFDFPIVPPPANVRYVGPVLDDPEWAEAWHSPWPADDPRPLVVASLSTTFQNQATVLEAIVAALGTLDVRGLVTLGPALAGATLDLPANVAAVESVAHAQVFPRASVVVCHGGHGTIMRALASGVPVACLPMGRDQDDNAARVEAHGVGLRLKRSASPERIRGAVARLLNGNGFREAARRLQRAILADVAARLDVEELEAVGRSESPAPPVAAVGPLATGPADGGRARPL